MRYKIMEVRGWVSRARDERRMQQEWQQAPLGVQADIMAALQRRKES